MDPYWSHRCQACGTGHPSLPDQWAFLDWWDSHTKYCAEARKGRAA
jgi:hypothetical protein